MKALQLSALCGLPPGTDTQGFFALVVQAFILVSSASNQETCMVVVLAGHLFTNHICSTVVGGHNCWNQQMSCCCGLDQPRTWKQAAVNSCCGRGQVTQCSFGCSVLTWQPTIQKGWMPHWLVGFLLLLFFVSDGFESFHPVVLLTAVLKWLTYIQ